MTDEILGDTPQAPSAVPEGKKAETRVYEVGYLLVPSIVESDVPREVTALHDILDKEGVSLISEEFPKFRPLAYEMRKHVGGAWENYGNAYFGWVKFEGSGEQAKRIDDELRRGSSLLRYLSVNASPRAPPGGAAPAAPRRPPRQARSSRRRSAERTGIRGRA